MNIPIILFVGLFIVASVMLFLIDRDIRNLEKRIDSLENDNYVLYRAIDNLIANPEEDPFGRPKASYSPSASPSPSEEDSLTNA